MNLIKWMVVFLSAAQTVLATTSNVIFSGGNSSGGNPPLFYFLPAGSSTLMQLTVENQSFIVCGAVDPLGNAFFGGTIGPGESAAIYTLPAGSLNPVSIFYPNSTEDLDIAQVNCIATASNGTAFFGGADNGFYGPGFTNRHHFALSYLLSSGSTTLTPIIPPTTAESQLHGACTTSDGTCFFGGTIFNDLDENFPLFYSLAPGSTQLNSLPVSSTNEGIIYCTAVTSDGTVLFAGQDESTDFPLLYTLSPGSNTLIPVAPPNSNQSALFNVAVGANGTAFFGGEGGPTGLSPCAYVYDPNPTPSLTEISLPISNNGVIFGVAVTPDGTAFFGGEDSDANIPLIYMLPYGSSSVTQLDNPAGASGFILSNGVSTPDGTVFFGGQDGSGLPFIYSIAPGSSTITPISIPPDAGTNSIESIVVLPPFPPQNFSGEQKRDDFAIEYELLNTLTWDSSSFPDFQNPIAYFIYRNGSRIATVDASILSYTDYNRKKGVPTFYQITASYSSGMESNPISIIIP